MLNNPYDFYGWIKDAEDGKIASYALERLEKKFKLVNEADSVLSDKKKKDLYDLGKDFTFIVRPFERVVNACSYDY